MQRGAGDGAGGPLWPGAPSAGLEPPESWCGTRAQRDLVTVGLERPLEQKSRGLYGSS